MFRCRCSPSRSNRLWSCSQLLPNRPLSPWSPRKMWKLSSSRPRTRVSRERGMSSVSGGSLIRVYFSVSVSAKVKRQRANRRLRRLLCPKTAVMALHELFNKEKTGQEIEIAVSEATQKNQFKAETVYQGKVYTGFGKWFFYLVATPGPMSASPCPLRAYGWRWHIIGTARHRHRTSPRQLWSNHCPSAVNYVLTIVAQPCVWER